MVAFDAVGPAGSPSAGVSGTVSPLSWTHVLGGSANAILVGVANANQTANNVSSVTIGASNTNIPLLGTTTNTAGNFVQWYGLLNPPTGSQTVKVNFTGTPGDMLAGSLSFTGASGFGTYFSNFSATNVASLTVNVTSTTPGGMVAVVENFGGQTWSAFTMTGSGGTVRLSDPVSSTFSGDMECLGTYPSTGSAMTVGVSNGASASDAESLGAIEVLPGSSIQNAPWPAIPPGRQSPMAFPFTHPAPSPPTSTPPTPITLADAAAGISEDGALVIGAALPLAEAGGAVEALSIAATEAGSDAAGAVEALSVAVAAPLAEVAAAVEANAVAIALADAAGAVDQLGVTVAVPLAEAGGAVDAPAINAAVPLTEAAGAVEALSISAAVVLADKGAAADAITEAVALALADASGAVEAEVSGVPIADADVAGAADSVVVAAAVPLAEVGAAADSITITVTASLADVAAAAESEVSGVPIGLAEAAGAVESVTASVTVPLPEVAAGADTAVIAAAVPLADVAGAADALSVQIAFATSGSDVAAARDALSVSVSVPLSESAGAADQLRPNVAVGLSEAAGAADLVLVVSGIHKSGTVTWAVRAEEPRWEAVPEQPRWSADAAPGRWSASPGTARWKTQPAQARWRIMMAAFDPISSDSLEEVNVRWTSDLDGTSIDPTVSPLTVQMAFPVSSGNLLLPAHATVWFAASWLAGGTGKGFVAQSLVGPGGGVVTLAAGKYDVWSWVQGTPESPKKFAGVLTVY